MEQPVTGLNLTLKWKIKLQSVTEKGRTNILKSFLQLWHNQKETRSGTYSILCQDIFSFIFDIHIIKGIAMARVPREETCSYETLNQYWKY